MVRKIMKKFRLTLLLILITTLTFAQKSPRKQANGTINNISILVDYGSPFVKERTIWGNLVPYGEVWRAGANENTTVSFDNSVKIKNITIPAGKYGFFIIPNEKDDWTIILNKKNNAWGAFSYKQEDDVIRIKLTPKFVTNNQESLDYTINGKGILFAWEKVRILIPIN